MAVDVPPELLNQYLMSRSVMQEPRSVMQRILDLILGQTYPEQATNALTGGVGAFSELGRRLAPSMSRMAVKEGVSSQLPAGFMNRLDFDLLKKWPELGAYTLDNPLTGKAGGEFLWDDIFKPGMLVNQTPDTNSILNYLLHSRITYTGR